MGISVLHGYSKGNISLLGDADVLSKQQLQHARAKFPPELIDLRSGKLKAKQDRM